MAMQAFYTAFYWISRYIEYGNGMINSYIIYVFHIIIKLIANSLYKYGMQLSQSGSQIHEK